MAPNARPPAPHDWTMVRSTVERLWQEQQTADYIARHLVTEYQLRVSKKMVYDRLRMWQAPYKYQRTMSGKVARAISTPREDVQLHTALSSTGAFLDEIAGRALWQSSALETALAFQNLISDAVMLIHSTGYDTRAIWIELGRMEDRLERLMSSFSEDTHPRVFTVLLGILARNPAVATPTQQAAVKAVKQMVWRKAIKTMEPSHPIPALCAVDPKPGRQDAFLSSFNQQLDSRLHSKISDTEPNFVAMEKVFYARALLTVCYPSSAKEVLQSVTWLDKCDTYTTAEYKVVLALTVYQEDTSEAYVRARDHLLDALRGYVSINKAHSMEALWAHYGLFLVARGEGNVADCAEHLEAVLGIWEAGLGMWSSGDAAAKSSQQSGGIIYVRDLDEAYRKLGKRDEMARLRDRFPDYFEESPLAAADAVSV